jgi:hypothetical protein
MDAGPPGEGGSEAGSTEAGSGEAGGGGDAGATDAGGDQACRMAGSQLACEQCCAMAHMQGYQTVLSAALMCGCCH